MGISLVITLHVSGLLVWPIETHMQKHTVPTQTCLNHYVPHKFKNMFINSKVVMIIHACVFNLNITILGMITQ